MNPYAVHQCGPVKLNVKAYQFTITMITVVLSPLVFIDHFEKEAKSVICVCFGWQFSQ